MQAVTELEKAFDQWLRSVFDDPSNISEFAEPEPTDCVTYLTRLFEEPDTVLASYSDVQINGGLWFLANASCSNHMFPIIEPGVAWFNRQRAIRSIAVLFKRLFGPRCSAHLSHLDETGANPLNLVCYMWWDIFPTHGHPTDPARADVDAELLAVMKHQALLFFPLPWSALRPRDYPDGCPNLCLSLKSNWRNPGGNSKMIRFALTTSRYRQFKWAMVPNGF
jgi:hypothetical protein